MKVLIVGSNGLLGQNLTVTAPKETGLILCGLEPQSFLPSDQPYTPVDITQASQIQSLIEKERPEWILNAAAMTNVDQCEREPDKCRSVNLDAVRWMAETGVPVVHLSTDYVFDGTKGPYREGDITRPLGVYGRIKLESESLVRKANTKSLVVRTMLLWGKGLGLRPSFVDFVKSNLEEKKNIRIVTDQIGDPTLASDLAEAIWILITRGCSGLYHVSGSERVSRYEWALQAAQFYELDPAPILTCRTSDLGQAAVRPLDSGFVLDKLIKDTGYRPKTLPEQLEACAGSRE